MKHITPLQLIGYELCLYTTKKVRLCALHPPSRLKLKPEFDLQGGHIIGADNLKYAEVF
ncbi:MAG: hypothetical protein J5I53_07155 [Bradyrhizobiaceae bacterium]|nr:hypothetical protein [Bradyrhizobiaceae bacterium]